MWRRSRNAGPDGESGLCHMFTDRPGGGRVSGLQAGLGAPTQEHKVYCLKPPQPGSVHPRGTENTHHDGFSRISIIVRRFLILQEGCVYFSWRVSHFRCRSCWAEPQLLQERRDLHPGQLLCVPHVLHREELRVWPAHQVRADWAPQPPIHPIIYRLVLFTLLCC